MPRGKIRIEDGAKRIRAIFDGEVVADTTRPRLVWEIPYYPTYFFHRDDVRTELLSENGGTKRSPSRGDATLYDLKGGSRMAESAAYSHVDSPIEELRDYVAFRWSSMDHWFEEDIEVHVHARDPYTRVDILPSSRHIRVEVDGVEVANSTRPTLVFETGLPTRYYLPKTDVRLDLLTPTDTLTQCPYKGDAGYWSVEVNGKAYPDIVWGYQHPVHESAPIAGMLAFYDEKVDVFVDGVQQERPKTKFA
jgi:uncharacterized protein (DUF427 family)